MHTKSNTAVLGTNNTPNGGLITGEKIDALHLPALPRYSTDQNSTSRLSIL